MKHLIILLSLFSVFTANADDTFQWGYTSDRNEPFVMGTHEDGSPFSDSKGVFLEMRIVNSVGGFPMVTLVLNGNCLGNEEGKIINNQPLRFNKQWLKMNAKCINGDELHLFPATQTGKNHLIQTMKSAKFVTWYAEKGEFFGHYSAKGFTKMWDAAVKQAKINRDAI